MSPHADLTLTLDMISQVEEGTSGTHFVSHTCRRRVCHGAFAAANEVPTSLVENVLAQGDCIITSVIVENEENITAVNETVRPLVTKLNEIAQLYEQADADMSVVENEGDRVAHPTRKRSK